MSWYARCVLPYLIDWAMRRDEATRLRAAHVPRARGSVLEVGIGSGLNLAFYTDAVTQVYGVDPSVELLEMSRARARGLAFPVRLVAASAEQLPLAGGTFDTVVVTWSLCSMARPDQALREMRRVLRPGGTFVFVEHGRSPDPRVAVWQDRATPLWRRVAGGCHLDRKVDDLVRDAGFDITELHTEYIPGPRPLTYMYEGHANADHPSGHHR